MSFDVLLFHFQNGELSPIDIAPLREALASNRGYASKEMSRVVVDFMDGGAMEIGGVDAPTAAEFSFFVRGMSVQLATFLWEASSRSGMAMLVMQEKCFLLNEASAKESDITVELRAHAGCLTVDRDEFLRTLFASFEAWRAW